MCSWFIFPLFWNSETFLDISETRRGREPKYSLGPLQPCDLESYLLCTEVLKTRNLPHHKGIKTTSFLAVNVSKTTQLLIMAILQWSYHVFYFEMHSSLVCVYKEMRQITRNTISFSELATAENRCKTWQDICAWLHSWRIAKILFDFQILT